MQLGRRQAMAGGALALLGGCTRAPLVSSRSSLGIRLAPLKADINHVMKVTVCLRPFRPAGPRLEVERFGDKAVVHNYGHGGSGWSLSWGCAGEAVALARSGGESRFAVIGAGVIGITTALRLIETGAQVTIYAEEFPAETRSSRATGVWSPSSRIALRNHIDPAFDRRWERWARSSYEVHRQHIGLTGDPVEFIPSYEILDPVREISPPAEHDFLHIGRRVRDMQPPWHQVTGSENPFPNRQTSTGEGMVFNVASYADRLTRQFLLLGGKMVRRKFADRTATLALPEQTIINCMGFGAKEIWGDPSLVPVRGQISWLVPQPEARHALYYSGVSTVSRRDGIVVQYLGPNEDFGYGDHNETPDPEETRQALKIISDLFA